MTDDQVLLLGLHLESLRRELTRIADALERQYPRHPDVPLSPPRDDAVTRASPEQRAQWARDDQRQRDQDQRIAAEQYR